MARRALVEILGDSRSYIRSLEQSAAATAAFAGDLKALSVTSETTTAKVVEASVARAKRLQQEALAYKELAASARAAGDVQTAAIASSKAGKREEQFAREVGIAGPAALAAQQAAARKAALEGAEHVGRSITRNVTVPTAIIGGFSIKANLDYEATLQKIVGLAGIAQNKIGGFNKEILKLAPSVGKSPQELANALYFIASSGVPASKAMEVLSNAAKASAAGLGETETVADAVTSVLNAYGVKNITAAQATDVLVATVREGKGEASDFAGVIGNVTAIASQLGVSFNDVGAALAAQTQLGTDAETSATQLQRVFTTLLKVTPQSEKAFEAVGLSAAGLRKELKEQGLLAFLETIKTKFQGNIPLLAKAFGDQRAIRGVLSLVGNNADKVAGVFERLGNASGSNQHAFEAINKSDLQQFHKATAAIQADMIKLGAALSPAISDLAGKVAKLADAFSALPKPVKTAFGELLIAFAVGGPIIGGATRVLRLIRSIRSALVLTEAAGAASGQLALFTGIETGAATALARVRLLQFGLVGIAAFAAAPIVIDIIENLRKKDKNVKSVKPGAEGAGHQGGAGPVGGKVFQRDGKFYEALNAGKSGVITREITRSEYDALVGNSHGFTLNQLQDRGKGPRGFTTPTPEEIARARALDKKTRGAGPILKFSLPYTLLLEQAKAQSAGEDVAAARDELAYVNKVIGSGRLRKQALLDALDKRRQLEDQLASYERDQEDKVKAARQKQLDALKKRGEFHLTGALQVAQAKADALSALNPNQEGPTAAQIKLAERVKAAALKAINSHRLSIQGLIDAWNAVGSANQTLAQKLKGGQTNTYHAVSSQALTAGLNLSRDARKLLEERLAQRSAHRGFAPTGVAAQGQVVNINNPNFNGVTDIYKLWSELEKFGRKAHGRAGRR